MILYWRCSGSLSPQATGPLPRSMPADYFQPAPCFAMPPSQRSAILEPPATNASATATVGRGLVSPPLKSASSYFLIPTTDSKPDQYRSTIRTQESIFIGMSWPRFGNAGRRCSSIITSTAPCQALDKYVSYRMLFRLDFTALQQCRSYSGEDQAGSIGLSITSRTLARKYTDELATFFPVGGRVIFGPWTGRTQFSLRRARHFDVQ